MKKIALVVLMAGTAMAASAQEKNLGTLSNVKGNISISGAGYVSKAVNGTPLLEGSKVLVSNNAKATVVLANGCSVPLTSGQHLTVSSALTCAQLQASVKELFTPYRVAQGQGGAAGATGATASGATVGTTVGVATVGTTAAVVGTMAAVSVAAVAAVNEDEVTSP